MATVKELEARLEELAELTRRLATHASVVAAAVREPNAVPVHDLNAALSGLDDVQAALLDF
jgi:uncharacterized protein YbjT (DUF2867 family)